jgi:hypothetical protein
MIKVKTLKKANLVGIEVPGNIGGYAGRYVEEILEQRGYRIDQGQGCDMPSLNIEVKTRDLDATSPQTIGTMSVIDIIETDYEDSPICEKIQQQYRIKTRNGVIVENKIYDFSDPYIQELIKVSYETGRIRLINDVRQGIHNVKYYPGGDYGYWERTTNSRSYSFRMSQSMMDGLETLSNNSKTFNTMFEIIK